MSGELRVETNKDGTATATVKNQVRTFPDVQSAVEWATAILYDLESEDEHG